MPAKAGIQYAAAYRFHNCCLWDTGSSAFADDDSAAIYRRACLEWWARCAIAHPADLWIQVLLRGHLMPRSGHAAAGLKQFCDFGQHADRRFAGHRHLRCGPGRRRWKVPDLLGDAGRLDHGRLDDGNTHHHGGVVEADVADRNRLGPAWRCSERRAVGLGGAVDLPRWLGRGEFRRPMRSWPDASWTAPNVAEAARAAKNTLKICDMTFCPAPQWRHGHNPGRAEGGPALLDHLTVYEKICGAMERLPGARSHPGSRLFPLPH